MVKYLLFDLDGTLTDPMEGICRSAAVGLAHFGIIEDYRNLTFFIGPPLIDTYMEHYGMTKEQAREAVAAFRSHFTPVGIFENEVYPGIPEMLERLKEAGFVTAVATSKPEEFAKRILEHFGLDRWIDFCFGATMDEQRTKKEEVLSYALEALGSPDPSKVLMIGDRCYDCEGAEAVGIRCAGVLYGYGSREELEEAGAYRIAESVDGLSRLLMELRGPQEAASGEA